MTTESPQIPGLEPQDKDSFFGALFDFSFRRYATPSVARALYILVFVFIAVLGFAALLALLTGLFSGTAAGVLGFLLGVPFVILVAIAGLALYRVYLEVAVSLIRTSQSVQAIDARQEQAFREQASAQTSDFPASFGEQLDAGRVSQDDLDDRTQYPGFGSLGQDSPQRNDDEDSGQ